MLKYMRTVFITPAMSCFWNFTEFYTKLVCNIATVITPLRAVAALIIYQQLIKVLRVKDGL